MTRKLCLPLLILLLISVNTYGGLGDSPKTKGDDWPVYGRDDKANHFSPLDQIDTSNIDQLGLAWSLDMEGYGSMYTSPIVVDGVIYFAMGYTVIHAVDARTGEQLWKYDPKAPERAGAKLRYSWGTRGISYSEGKIFAGTVDGRLLAINAADGTLAWSAQTTEGEDDGRYITGAPWVFDGKVVVGHGGADFALVRGYVTAYDAANGKQLWRFYTVPGDPALGFESLALEKAAETWTGKWWEFGGGGTVWNAMAYDAEFHRLYIGTGNGTPWNHRVRSPQGGDNLFLCSIVALDPDTGEYIWHYQINPGESWDYNAAMDIELTHLQIDGEERPVILHAPKNGFFYVLDRETGQLISAEPFVPVNWAERIDLETGRPVENPAARYPGEQGFVLRPGTEGAHNVQAMSYSAETGLAYIPVYENATYFNDAGINAETWEPPTKGYVTALGDKPPPDPLPPRKGYLLAWDPVKQKEIWRADLHEQWGGGVISTAGNLVFIGQPDGQFIAYAADSGKRVWSFNAQAGISSQPITYAVNGKQYVTLLTGYRGVVFSSPWGWDYRHQKRRVLTFALGGDDQLPEREVRQKAFVEQADFEIDPALAGEGENIYLEAMCYVCHGLGLEAGGSAPDLRESAIPLSFDVLDQVLRKGILVGRGMPAFSELREAQVRSIQHYIRRETRRAVNEVGPTKPEKHIMTQ